MIEVPEPIILDLITNLLLTDLPPILLELEEQSENSIHIPPFRYAGPSNLIPTGTREPYALLEITESAYTEKDRIIKNVRYIVTCTLQITEVTDRWHYNAAIKTVVERTMTDSWRLKIEELNKQKEIIFQITKK